MFLLPSSRKERVPAVKERVILACPECGENLVSSDKGRTCIRCNASYSESGLLEAYSAIARKNYRKKVNQRFQDLSNIALNEALEKERRENHQLRLENDRLRNESLARDPLFQSERLASLEARMASMETLLHDLVADD